MTFPMSMANGNNAHGIAPPITRYSAPTDLSDPPSPHTKHPSLSIPIPESLNQNGTMPIAGPSSEGAIYQLGVGEES